MKVLVCTEPGKFEYQQINEPKLQPNHAILKIQRIGICGTDLHAFEGTQPFFSYPRILGHELAATIVDIETNNQFFIGDAVTFIPYFNCNNCVACNNNKPNCCVNIKVFGVHINGGMAEYIMVPIPMLIKANQLSYNQLALVEPLAIGAHGVKRANVQPKEFVLVIGAGPIGLGTIEFARIAKAQVIVLDVNEHRLNFCKQNLQVPYCINATANNVTEQLMQITNGNMPTVVIDCTGNLHAINNGFSYIAHGGTYVLIGLQKGNLTIVHPEFHKREATLMSSRNATKADFEHVIQAMQNNWVNPANYITHTVSFDKVIENFSSYLKPENNVIKAMITM